MKWAFTLQEQGTDIGRYFSTFRSGSFYCLWIEDQEAVIINDSTLFPWWLIVGAGEHTWYIPPVGDDAPDALLCSPVAEIIQSQSCGEPVGDSLFPVFIFSLDDGYMIDSGKWWSLVQSSTN